MPKHHKPKHHKPKLYHIDWFLFGMGIAFMAIGTFMTGAAMELHPSWRNLAIGLVLFGVFSAMFLTEAITKVGEHECSSSTTKNG